ncbi:MAG: hypothetical protein H6732_15695 [Alphaproteobacteria bacterium]|nr:hypothetical protein [Alphaproteobacteria bacterium]
MASALVRTGVVHEAVDDAGQLPPEPGDPRVVDAGGERLAHGAVDPSVREALARLRPGSKDMQVAAYADLLGRVPDAEVARRAGVSIRTIASFRARHAIPGYAGPRRPATRRASAPRAAPEPGDVAWRVVLRGDEGDTSGVVVATDLAQAAARAEAAGRGEVVSLERIGPVLG